MAKTLLGVLAARRSPPPIWLMRQAGRYLPEYRALRAGPRLHHALHHADSWPTEVTLQPVRRFGMDAAILFSDLPMLPWALGQAWNIADGEGPVLPPIRDAAGLAELDPGRVAKALAPILETVQRVRAEASARRR